ncbi:MAG: septum formation initiator family protein [Endomicrobia bacterium]|nr:septum formation initiator family protein [Endomicrobiia bacterium]MCL2799183.1 septum formation initiator family protein [Endomicrobiia bacterium]
MKKFKIKIRYIILAVALAFLFLNDGARTLARHFVEIQRLNNDIKKAEAQNELYKSRINRLENVPEYMEREIRAELKVIAPGEIEYRFLSEDEEKKKAKEK